jgi:hypothetical protein
MPAFLSEYHFYSPLGPWPLLFSFMIILQTVGLLGRVISSSQGLYLNTGKHKHRKNTYTHQTSMLCVGFKPTIPAPERAKTVHSLGCSATVTGRIPLLHHIYFWWLGSEGGLLLIIVALGNHANCWNESRTFHCCHQHFRQYVTVADSPYQIKHL